MRLEYLAVALIFAGIVLIVTNLISKAGNTLTQMIGIVILSVGIIIAAFIPRQIDNTYLTAQEKAAITREIPILSKQSIMYKELPMTKLHPLNCRLDIKPTRLGRIL